MTRPRPARKADARSPLSAANWSAAVCRAGLFQFATNQVFTNGPIQSRALFWCKSGYGKFLLDGERFNVEPHDLYLLPWNRVITYQPAARDPMYTAHVHLVPWYRPGAPWLPNVPHNEEEAEFDSANRRDVDWLGKGRVVRLHARSDESLGRLIDYSVRWYRESKRDEQEARALGLLLVREIVQSVGTAPTAVSGRPVEMRQMMVHVERSFQLSPSIQDLASIIGRSRSHVLKLFRRHLGISAKSYILARQMQEARELLMSTSLHVWEIAAASGFSDPYHFSKQFSRHVGLSPLKFRATHGPFAASPQL
ncbi:MAG: AraC family transcriptional regulator [Opitutus sp.]